MKNSYRLILLSLVMFGVVYAGAETEKKSKEPQYKPIELCKFPVTMKVGHFVQLKECHKRKIELKQVDCEEIRKGSGDFPCYKGNDAIEVRANFPAIFTASINKNEGNEDLLPEVNLYWENGVNTIKGTCEWEELKLHLEVCNVDFNNIPAPGTIEVGEISIKVRPPDDPNYCTKDDIKDIKKSED